MFNVVDTINSHLRRVNLEKTKKSITTSYGPETVSVKVATHQCCSGQIRRRLQCVQYIKVYNVNITVVKMMRGKKAENEKKNEPHFFY